MVKVLLADNQHLTAAGLTHWLQNQQGYHVVGLATNKDELSTLLQKHKPDLLIADYTINGQLSIDDLRISHSFSPDTNILILSSDDDRHRILQVLQLEVKGFLNKQSTQQEVMSAIKAIVKGEKFFSQQVLNIMLESSAKVREVSQELTEREKELLKLLAKGYSTQRAADEMNLSPHTIHTHRKNIIKKLNIKSPTQFVLHAIDLKLIVLP
ncbi:MAG TPA: response regulator transcription factor [Cyclobacteriaceae bacterium]